MKQNVLIFGHSYAPQFVDISNQYTVALDREKYQITVVYLSGPGSEVIRQKHLANEVIFLNCSRASMRGLKIEAIVKMLKLHKEKKFDIVITHRYKPTFIMMMVALRYDIPTFIAVMHELDVFSSFARQCTVKLLAKNNLIFAGVSNAVRDNIKKQLKFLPEQRVVTLYNVIDTELTEPQYVSKEVSRQFFNIDSDQFVFCNIGRLVENKDQVTLIKAFARIADECPKALLIIMGSGELEKELTVLIQSLQLQNRIRLMGFVENAFSYLPGCDVFVLSSKQEAFGRVLLEAMLAKIPVIATTVNGVPEVVDSAGTLIASGNIDAMAKALKDYYELDREALSQCAKRGYDRVCSHFSIESFKKTLYKTCVVK